VHTTGGAQAIISGAPASSSSRQRLKTASIMQAVQHCAACHCQLAGGRPLAPATHPEVVKVRQLAEHELHCGKDQRPLPEAAWGEAEGRISRE
jgi:hypothetical protein